MTLAEDRPRLIEGGLHVDVRGSIAFVNDFDFQGVDRFYVVRSHRSQEPRGWIGHRREHKRFFVVQGTSLIAVVKPNEWQTPAGDLSVERFTLSAAKPQILSVPPGFATGSINLTADAILLVFSSGKIEDAKTDDYRFPVGTWPIMA